MIHTRNTMTLESEKHKQINKKRMKVLPKDANIIIACQHLQRAHDQNLMKFCFWGNNEMWVCKCKVQKKKLLRRNSDRDKLCCLTTFCFWENNGRTKSFFNSLLNKKTGFCETRNMKNNIEVCIYVIQYTD